ncbi:hypothetical protein T06_9711 [Trichinella sp. T6]|nr:hypothetical protein T06_9711 [Trichinella sp. T6]
MMVMGHHAKGRGNVDGTDRQDIYVQHLKTGCDRNEETQTLVLQVSEIMSTGGFVSCILLTFGGSVSGQDKLTVENPRLLLEPPERQTLWRTSHHRCINLRPKLQSHQVAILLRFSPSRIWIQADIKKMYLQIGRQPEDQELCRFMWQKAILELLHRRLTSDR